MEKSELRQLKILFVHEVDYRKKVIYEIHEFPEIFARHGHQVTFIDFAEESQLLRQRGKRSDFSGRVDSGVTISLVTPGRIGKGTFARISSMFTVIPWLFQVFLKNRPDVVVNYAVPTYGLQVNAIARLFKIPVIHRALDVAHLIRESPWNPLIKLFEHLTLKKSYGISTNNLEMSSYVKTIVGTKKVVERHFPPLDLDFFAKRAREQSLAVQDLAMRLSGKYVVMYFGSFFYFSNLDQIIQEFSRKRGPNDILLLIGGGEQDQYLRDLVHSLELEDTVIFTGYINFEDIPTYFQLADVAINPLQVSEVANIAFPNKVLQYLASELPVVSTKLSGLILEFEGSGVITWAEGPGDIVDKSLYLSKRLVSGNLPSPIEYLQPFDYEASYEALLNFLQDQIIHFHKGQT